MPKKAGYLKNIVIFFMLVLLVTLGTGQDT